VGLKWLSGGSMNPSEISPYKQITALVEKNENIQSNFGWMRGERVRAFGDLSAFALAAIAALDVPDPLVRSSLLAALADSLEPKDRAAVVFAALGTDNPAILDQTAQALGFDASDWRFAPVAGFFGAGKSLKWLAERGASLEGPSGQTAVELIARRATQDSFYRKEGQGDCLALLCQPATLAAMSAQGRSRALDAVAAAYEKLCEDRRFAFEADRAELLRGCAKALVDGWAALTPLERTRASRGSMVLFMAGLDLDDLSKEPNLKKREQQADKLKKDGRSARDHGPWDETLAARQSVTAAARSVDWAPEEARAQTQGWTFFAAPIAWREDQKRQSKFSSNSSFCDEDRLGPAMEAAQRSTGSLAGQARGLLSQQAFGASRLDLGSPVGRELASWLPGAGQSLSVEECFAALEDCARRVRLMARDDGSDEDSKPSRWGSEEQTPQKRLHEGLKRFEHEMMSLYQVLPEPAWSSIINGLANDAGCLNPRDAEREASLNTFAEHVELALASMQAALGQKEAPIPGRKKPARI
jgi:hypothetical protein